jgi:hypothetical protein
MASYAEERVAARRAINKQSKQRAAEMERRIAKFLLGQRVPMSGAGAIKGDCDIQTEKVGKIFIECKYSASVDRQGKQRIIVFWSWLDKMYEDAASMKARMAALVFRYHGTRLSDYVIIRTDVLEKYDSLERLEGAATLDTGLASSYTLYKHKLDALFAANTSGRQIGLIMCNRGTFVVMTIADFKEIIHGTDTI